MSPLYPYVMSSSTSRTARDVFSYTYEFRKTIVYSRRGEKHPRTGTSVLVKDPFSESKNGFDRATRLYECDNSNFKVLRLPVEVSVNWSLSMSFHKRRLELKRVSSLMVHIIALWVKLQNGHFIFFLIFDRIPAFNIFQTNWSET